MITTGRVDQQEKEGFDETVDRRSKVIFIPLIVSLPLIALTLSYLA